MSTPGDDRPAAATPPIDVDALDGGQLAAIARRLVALDGGVPAADAVLALPDAAAWGRLGTRFLAAGNLPAARIALMTAIVRQPQQALTHVGLGNVLMLLDELPAAEAEFRTALALEPEMSVAHQGLACIFHRRAEPDKAGHHLNLAFRKQALFTLGYRGPGQPVGLLILASALEGNIPWNTLIDSTIFQASVIAVEYFDAQAALPPHRLVFNAIGDAELCPEGLRLAQRIAARTRAAVINRPEAVMQTGRLANARRLSGLPGVTAPRIVAIGKADHDAAQTLDSLTGQGFAFPLLLRVPGFHGGSYFTRVDGPEAFRAAFGDLPGDAALAIEFLDPGADDALFRKYRVLSIDGALYPLHLAISRQWKVHYFSSEMAANADFRREEAAFLGDFRACLGAAAIAALEGIAATLGLDYCGIDFGVDRQGNILLYEANSTMSIAALPDETQWDYKRPAVARAIRAARRMLLARADVGDERLRRAADGMEGCGSAS